MKTNPMTNPDVFNNHREGEQHISFMRKGKQFISSGIHNTALVEIEVICKIRQIFSAGKGRCIQKEICKIRQIFSAGKGRCIQKEICKIRQIFSAGKGRCIQEICKIRQIFSAGN